MVDYVADRFHPSRIYITDTVVVCDSIRSSTQDGSKPSGLDNMFITQPPVSSVHIVIPGLGGHRCRAADKTAGVTFADVFGTYKSNAAKHWYRDCREWWICFGRRVFVVSAEARAAVERAGELSSEDDPTRWVLKDGDYVLEEGGFEFI